MLCLVSSKNSKRHFILTFQILHISTKTCTFDIYDYCETILLLYVFNNIGVSSLKKASAPKHVAAN